MVPRPPPVAQVGGHGAAPAVAKEMRHHPQLYRAEALASAPLEIKVEIDDRISSSPPVPWVEATHRFRLYTEIVGGPGVRAGEVELKALALGQRTTVHVLRVSRHAAGHLVHQERVYRPQSPQLERRAIRLLQTGGHFDFLVEAPVG